MDMKCGTYNVRGLCGAGSLKTVESELAKYNFDLVGVQEVTWVRGGSESAEDYTLLFGNGNANHHFGTGFFIRNGIRAIVTLDAGCRMCY
jgi:exonuclease III